MGGTKSSDISKTELTGLGVQRHMQGKEESCEESQVVGRLGKGNVNAMTTGTWFCSLLSPSHLEQDLAPEERCSLHMS